MEFNQIEYSDVRILIGIELTWDDEPFEIVIKNK